jgi:hypothetical protein
MPNPDVLQSYQNCGCLGRVVGVGVIVYICDTGGRGTCLCVHRNLIIGLFT